MQIKAYAKINLGLDVIRRREDGYHEVRMIMQNIGLHDVLELSKSSNPGIRISTNKDNIPVNEDNLIYKSARLLLDEFGITEGLDVKLTKNIPVAAGLAGGSTDAAATLIGINNIWGLGLTTEELMERGVRIGADVPYCILGGTAVAEGIGEVLTSLEPCPDCYVIIAKPAADVSTKHVYTSLKLDGITHPNIDAILEGISRKNIVRIAENLGNVLESVTIKEHPVINDIKEIMMEKGALASLMSGSGPTVFGIFDNEELAKVCLSEIEKSGKAKDYAITTMHNPA